MFDERLLKTPDDNLYWVEYFSEDCIHIWAVVDNKVIIASRHWTEATVKYAMDAQWQWVNAYSPAIYSMAQCGECEEQFYAFFNDYLCPGCRKHAD